MSIPQKLSIPIEFSLAFNRGCKLLEQGDNAGAEKQFDDCAKACPEAWLGVACEELRDGNKNHSVLRFEQVLRHATNYKTRAVALCNIGMILNNNGKRSESEPLFLESFKLWKRADTATNIALCRMYAGDIPAAESWIGRAMRMEPTNETIWFNRALISLFKGDYAQGFREYEARWKNPQGRIKRPPIFRPEWKGEDIGSKTLLVYGEQGAGDTIQMLRYGPMLKQRCNRLLLAPQRGVGPLAMRMGCWDDVYEDIFERIEKGNVPFYHVQVPAMSLPRIFGTTVDTIPASPYIPKPGFWAPGPVLNIGFCWAGSVDHAHDLWRSTHLSDWAPLFGIPGTRWFSLQLGPRTIELLDEAYPIQNAAEGLKTYLDTATVLSAMDLVISVDTSLVHLAGAMGIPVWMLTPTAPDWRWMANREDSPWYSSLRLFRQTKELQWSDVIERIAHEIQRIVADEARPDGSQPQRQIHREVTA